MLVRPGATMCGNHSGAGAACAHCRTRVADLAKHAPRCPAFLHKAAAAARPHYALDANVGNLEGDAEAAREEAASLAADARAAALDAPALRAFAARVRDACEKPASTPRRTARTRARGTLAPACARALRAQELASARAARGGVGAPPFERRHAEQHAAIVSRMIAADLVRDEDASEDPALEDDDDDELQEKGPDEIAKAAAESSKSSNVARAAPTSPPSSKPPPVYVELGAGRGYLSHFLLDACGPADVVLVERETYRHKAERSIGAAYAERNRLARRGEKKNVLPLPEETVEEETAEAEEDARLVRSAIARRERSRVSRLRVDIKDLRLAGAAERRGAASSRRGNTCAAPPPTSR